MIKYGRTKSGNQDIFAGNVGKLELKIIHMAYKEEINQNIIQLSKEGLGIRSMARILKISITALLKRIISIAGNIVKSIISRGKTYEVDELCAYNRHKKNYIWLVYNIDLKLYYYIFLE